MQLFVCSEYTTKTGLRHGIRTLFNILIVHFVMNFFVLLAFQVEMHTGSLSPLGCFYCLTAFLNFTI